MINFTSTPVIVLVVSYTYYSPLLLPSHSYRLCCYWLSAICYGKKNNSNFTKNTQNTTESGLGSHGGPVTTRQTTTGGWPLAVSPPGQVILKPRA